MIAGKTFIVLVIVIGFLLIPSKQFSFHDAVASGCLPTVEQMLEDDPQLPKISDQDGRMALHSAALNNHTEIVRLLVEYDAEINVLTRKKGWSPLHCACIGGNSRIIKILLAGGCDVFKTDKRGKTPMYYAKLYNHQQAQRLLNKYCEMLQANWHNDERGMEDNFIPQIKAYHHGTVK